MDKMNRRRFLAGCLAVPIIGTTTMSVPNTPVQKTSLPAIYKERKYLCRFAHSGGYLLWHPKKEITSTSDVIFESLGEVELNNLKCISFSLDVVGHFSKYKTVGRWMRHGYCGIVPCRVVIAPLLEGFSWSFETAQWMEGEGFDGRVLWEDYREYKIENLPSRKPGWWSDDFEKQMYGLRTNG